MSCRLMELNRRSATLNRRSTELNRRSTKLNHIKTFLKEEARCVTSLLVCFVMLTAVLVSQICILETPSGSIPYSWCLQIYNLKPRKGDLCVFKLNNRKFIKYIVGVAGDEIKNIDGEIFVGGVKVGKAFQAPILTPVSDGVIPAGYVFVAGTHSDSLDSRYKEFGLIKTHEIKGKAIGLWKCEK